MADPVLIVGAGPVGLTAALALAQQGVPVRIIDRLAHCVNQSRAAVIHARTAELLERLGVMAPFLREAIRVRAITARDPAGRTLLRVALDELPTAFNFFLGIGQDATERLLAEALAGRGVTVERSVSLASLTQTADGVTAALTHADGRAELAVTPYLLGCDGARSAVRHQLGVPLEGETLDVYWVTADVKLDWREAVPADEAIGLPSPAGVGFVMPLPGGRWRVIVDMGPKPAELPHEVPLEDVQAACDRVGIRARVHDPVWISPFGINTRLVPTMRVGRVFLAGDAAHVHSPVGGQGMNTGMQDAINLAWKLALTLAGRAAPALLASYDAERHANAKRLLGFVGPATRLVDLKNPVAVGLRNLALAAASHLGAASLAARRAGEIDVHYRHSPVVAEHHQGTGAWLRALVHHEPHPGLFDCWDFGKGPHAGERAPDAHGLADGAAPPRRLFEDWVGDHRHQLLVFTGLHPRPGRVAELAALADDVARQSGGLIRARLVRPAALEDAAGGLADTADEAHHVYGARYECLYLVRPDGYVAFRSQPAEAGPLRTYLAGVLVGA